MLIFCNNIYSQDKENLYPVNNYKELENPNPTDLESWKGIKDINCGWGELDIRYRKETPVTIGELNKTITLTGWRGERVAAQIVVSTPKIIEALSYKVGELKNKRGNFTINNSDLLTGFVRFVITDELNKDGLGACGHRPDPSVYKSHLASDPIDHITKVLEISENSTQPIWVAINIPSNAKAGLYKGEVTIYNNDTEIGKLYLNLKVIDRVLPEPKDWKFHLDLWQNPYASARYYNVEPFSDNHFNKMKADFSLYANAGGKSITASLMHKPWGGQTQDYFESMVTWIKKADGTWMYDFTVFDRWVEFMMDLGVTKSINCYSMVPWDLSFQYFNQATNSFKYLKAKPGDKEYDYFWGSMLSAFAEHLKEKGWFEITHIAMDERPLEAMFAAKKVIETADPNFKMSLAGNYFKELEQDLDDYCVAFRYKFPVSEIEKRRKDNKVTTFYTCCTEPKPNTFTFSNPAEAAWLAGYALNYNYDGYLRWALNSWVEQPLLDSRFRSWAAGDTYLIYPGGRTSIRFERLREGIQNFEKYHILKNEFTKSNNKRNLKKLEKAITSFNPDNLSNETINETVYKLEKVLNSF
jgi:hypothetical protein